MTDGERWAGIIEAGVTAAVKIDEDHTRTTRLEATIEEQDGDITMLMQRIQRLRVVAREARMHALDGDVLSQALDALQDGDLGSES